MPDDFEESLLIIDHFPNAPIMNIFINQYLLALGEFDALDSYDGVDQVACWVFFLMATFITQITFLNMLIAVMGDTYAKVTETKDQNALSEKVSIMADYVTVINDTEKHDRYLVLTKPSDADDGDSWEGTVATVRKNLDRAVLDMSNVFSKRFTVLSTEVATFSAQIQAHSDKVGHLQSQIQKQAGVVDQVTSALKQMLKERDPGVDDQKK